MATISVPLGDRTYSVDIQSGLIDRVGEYARKLLGGGAVAMITDDHVAPLYLKRVEA